MTSREIQVRNINRKGEHLPSQIVQIACRYDSSIKVSADDRTLNAKSLMGILSFPFADDMVLTIEADGKDEKDAIEALGSYLM